MKTIFIHVIRIYLFIKAYYPHRLQLCKIRLKKACKTRKCSRPFYKDVKSRRKLQSINLMRQNAFRERCCEAQVLHLMEWGAVLCSQGIINKSMYKACSTYTKSWIILQKVWCSLSNTWFIDPVVVLWRVPPGAWSRPRMLQPATARYKPPNYTIVATRWICSRYLHAICKLSLQRKYIKKILLLLYLEF